MEKQEIINAMKKQVNGAEFITKQQLAGFMGIKDPKNINQYIKGLEAVNGKYFFIPDIAKVLWQRSRKVG